MQSGVGYGCLSLWPYSLAVSCWRRGFRRPLDEPYPGRVGDGERSSDLAADLRLMWERKRWVGRWIRPLGRTRDPRPRPGHQRCLPRVQYGRAGRQDPRRSGGSARRPEGVERQHLQLSLLAGPKDSLVCLRVRQRGLRLAIQRRAGGQRASPRGRRGTGYTEGFAAKRLVGDGSARRRSSGNELLLRKSLAGFNLR